MEETVWSHFRLRNANLWVMSVWRCLSFLLRWHDRFALIQLLNLLTGYLLSRLGSWQINHSEVLSFHNTFLKSTLIHLLILWELVTTFGVDIMSQHAVTVTDAAKSRVSVSSPIEVERRLT